MSFIPMCYIYNKKLIKGSDTGASRKLSFWPFGSWYKKGSYTVFPFVLTTTDIDPRH